MNQNGGSRTETLVKLVLIFVISLLSFSVGTFVGKQFSDNQHKMTALQKEFNVDGERDPASENAPVVATENKEEALTDEDIAELTKEFIEAEKEDTPGEVTADIEKAKIKELEEEVKARMAEKAKAANNMAKKEEPVAAKKPMMLPEKNAPVAQAAKRLAEGKAPTPNPTKMKRMPSSLPKMVSASTIGKYTVQVASYMVEGEAKSHAQKLIGQGFSAFYIEAVVKGKKWYRVSVGLFGSKKSAMSYRKTFMKQAQISSAIVQRIVR